MKQGTTAKRAPVRRLLHDAGSCKKLLLKDRLSTPVPTEHIRARAKIRGAFVNAPYGIPERVTGDGLEGVPRAQ